MSEIQVLFVAGTHGNEVNASWLFDHWIENPEIIDTSRCDFSVLKVIGNNAARKAGKRYLDRDLNRCFTQELLNSEIENEYEINRAKDLVDIYGVNGSQPCQIVVDCHSTTSGMGSCLVVYGRRPLDLALASLMQNSLGLPIYLHESDCSQTGFLVESWPCGFVLEIGPVPQGLLHSEIINQTKLALETCLEQIRRVKEGKAVFPERIFIHRHLRSIDYPRDLNGLPSAVIHPERQNKDWELIKSGDPLFLTPTGEIISFMGCENVIPVFINEVSYVEKNIAMSFTIKESWQVLEDWKDCLFFMIGD